jgi:hypothetical protein
LNNRLAAVLAIMAESFGNAFTIVEVTADDWSAGRPRKEFWVAAAKPSQALTLVLAAVPEGWTAELVNDRLTQQQQAALEKLNLQPGEVCKFAK